MRIGDSIVMASGIGPRDPMPAFLYLALTTSMRLTSALEAGAVCLEEPADMPYGNGADWLRVRAARIGKSLLTKDVELRNPAGREMTLLAPWAGIKAERWFFLTESNGAGGNGR